jgi:hypothetical protein
MVKKMNDPDVQADGAPEKADKPVVEATDNKAKFYTYEVWRLEWKGMGADRKLERVNMKKEVVILDEHAAILNEQRENTLLEYTKKGG